MKEGSSTSTHPRIVFINSAGAFVDLPGYTAYTRKSNLLFPCRMSTTWSLRIRSIEGGRVCSGRHAAYGSSMLFNTNLQVHSAMRVPSKHQDRRLLEEQKRRRTSASSPNEWRVPSVRRWSCRTSYRLRVRLPTTSSGIPRGPISQFATHRIRFAVVENGRSFSEARLWYLGLVLRGLVGVGDLAGSTTQVGCYVCRLSVLDIFAQLVSERRVTFGRQDIGGDVM
jgi:hypothetical protein